MRTEEVEIYSDATNLAVMRHPGRRFPGALVQGDSLWTLCKTADRACDAHLSPEERQDALEILRSALWARLNHYKTVLLDHDISLPFSDQG